MASSARRSRPNRAGALIDIVLISVPILIFGITGTLLGTTEGILGGAIINLGYMLAVLVGWRLLKRRGTSWREIGLARPTSGPRTILLGIAAMLGAVVVWLLVQNAAAVLLNPQAASIDESRFNPLRGNLAFFLLMLLLAWTVIAFGEEMVYRAFLTTRLIEIFPPGKAGTALAAIGSSFLFGLAHYPAEGLIGILSNGAIGLLFAWIYLRSGLNLWITIIGHALLNTLRFALLYAGAV